MQPQAKAPPSVIKSYLELCRASNLPTVWTNVLAAVLLSGTALTASAPIVAAALSMTLIYLGGMALNDVLDVEEDRVKKPKRPIPSGRISQAGALAFAVGLFAAALGLLSLFGSRDSFFAGSALVVVVYLYDRMHSQTPLTVLLMAGCRALVFITSALAVAGTLNRLVLVGAAMQFVYIVTLTVVARWEKATTREFKIPPIPWLLAGISLIDGLMLAILINPLWLLAGIAGAVLTRLLQTQVRGD